MFANLPDVYRAILHAAIAAVEPANAVRRALGSDLHSHFWRSARDRGLHDPATARRVIVIGAGKAAAPMASGVESILGSQIAEGALDGLVVTKHGHARAEDEAPLQAIRVVEAGHPLPDAAGLAAGEEILRLAASAKEDDLVIALLSGGGSALLEALAPPITLDDWQRTTALLLASGAGIGEVNTVRKRLSRIKGGELARVVAPASLVTLVLSDVVGSPLDAIASGPTVPDSTTWQDAWNVVQKYGLRDKAPHTLPDTVRSRLEAGLRGELPETPKRGDGIFARTVTEVIGDNQIATTAAAETARELGYHADVRTNALEGEAAEVAGSLIDEAKAYQVAARTDSSSYPVPACLIWGGETTVTLGGATGTGGRNQEMALAAALALEGTRGIHFVALATDGTDGPTDAAGGYVDGDTVDAARTLGIDLREALGRHDAYPTLRALNALILTGPTRTNVNDIAFAFIESGG